MKKLMNLTIPDFQNEQDQHSIIQALEEVDGVIAVYEERPVQRILVTYDAGHVDTFGLAEAITATGFQLPVETYQLDIRGMTCAACAFHVESALTDVPGVIAAQVDLKTNCATIKIIPSAVQPATWQQALATAGYQLVSPAVRLH